MITERVDNITEIKHRVQNPPAPKSVKIELTGRCNLKCSFCATSDNLREKRDMNWTFYSERLLPMLREAGVEEVGMFFLGESTILPWLPSAIQKAKELGFPYVFLTTNGTALTEKKLDSYMKAGLDSLKFSLNYANAEQFSAIARVKPALFMRMIESIKTARRIRDERGYKCGLYASYIDYDDEQGAMMKALVDELGNYLDEIYALPLYSQADLTGKSSEDSGWVVRAGNPGRAGNMREPVPCWSLFSEGRVSWDGSMSACCFDHTDDFDMGDLTKNDFMDIWNSDKFQALRSSHLNRDIKGTVCEGCVAWN